MRRTTGARWVAGAAVLPLALAACSGSGTDPDGGGSGSVSVNSIEPENPLIPSNTNEVGGGNVIDGIFTGLVRLDPTTAEPVLAVAESIESSDNQTWTITLEEGWTFHDDTPVTAQSFVDAWNWGAYGPNAQLNSRFFGPDGAGIQGYDELQGEDANDDGEVTEDEVSATEMSGLEVVDETTFTVTLDKPFVVFPQIVAYNAFYPLPESFFDDPDAFGEAPVGNGPFEFVQWDNGQQIVLAANDSYAGEESAKVDEVVFRIYSSLDAAYADLVSNNLDVLDNIPVSALADDAYKNDIGERWSEIVSGTISTITLPLYVDEYNSPDLGKALSLAIDRQAISTQIFNDTRTPADGWASPVVDGYVADQCGDLCELDVERAKDFFEESGFDGTLTLSYNADGDHKAWTEAVCNQISSNLEVECIATPEPDFATLRQNVNAREMSGMFRTGWVFDYPSLENFLAPLYTTTGGANDGDYSNEAFDTLIAEAGASSTIEEANVKYQEAERLLAEDMPVIPLWNDRQIGGWSENVADLQFSPRDRVELTTIELK